MVVNTVAMIAAKPTMNGFLSADRSASHKPLRKMNTKTHLSYDVINGTTFYLLFLQSIADFDFTRGHCNTN